MPDDVQRKARLAIGSEQKVLEFDRGMKQGEDTQREHDAESYRRKVVPIREALLAAANDAAASVTLDATAVLERLIANVRRDATRIPERLPT